MTATTAASLGVKMPENMPPRMITGVISPQLALFSVRQMVVRESGVPFGYWRL